MELHDRTDHNKASPRNWPGVLIFGLLYPAVLGTFFYSLLPETFGVLRSPMQASSLQGIKLLLSFLLIAHFLVDFYYTQQVALETSTYPGKAFFIDLAIVLALFVAYDAVHLDERGTKPEVFWVAGAMSVSYILFSLWGYNMRGVIGKNRRLAVYEVIAAGGFFLIAVVWINVYVLAGALVLSALLMYIIGGPIVARFHVERQEKEPGNGDKKPIPIPRVVDLALAKDFRLKEYDRVSSELQAQLEEAWRLEKFAIGGSAALTAWLITNTVSVPWARWLPLLFVLACAIRFVAAMSHIVFRLGRYIKALEQAFIGESGWEHWFRGKALNQALAHGLLWIILIGLAGRVSCELNKPGEGQYKVVRVANGATAADVKSILDRESNSGWSLLTTCNSTADEVLVFGKK